ncbi:hypothetical protein Lser_V15G03415 [Lactuca serriola]
MRTLANPWFSKFLIRVGDGDEEAIDGSFIRIPDDMCIASTDQAKSKYDLINVIFPSLQINGGSSDYIISRAILSTKNENVDQINKQLIDSFHGDEKVYYSFDKAEEQKNNLYPTKFLNSLNVSGFQMNVINVEIVVGHQAGKRVFLPRIPLCPFSDDMFPFKLKGKQFPVRLSLVVTINKAQVQTIPNVGFFLPESVFSHGQLYVALSIGICDNPKFLSVQLFNSIKVRLVSANF